MFQRREGTVGFKQGHNKFSRKVSGVEVCTILNGGFEVGDLTGWDQYCLEFTCTNTVVMNGAQEGVYYLNMHTESSGASDYGKNDVYQWLNCYGVGYKLHFRYRTSGNAWASRVKVYVNFRSENPLKVYSQSLSYPIGWTEVDMDFPANVTGNPIKVMFHASEVMNHRSIDFDLDDVYMHIP